MSEKRKDAKGQVLRTEESQRKDLIYLCQYTDIREKRQTIDSSDLKELREKEQKIQASQRWDQLCGWTGHRDCAGGPLH